MSIPKEQIIEVDMNTRKLRKWEWAGTHDEKLDGTTTLGRWRAIDHVQQWKTVKIEKTDIIQLTRFHLYDDGH